MFQIRNIILRPTGGAATPAGVPLQNHIDNPATSASNSNSPRQHGRSSRTNRRFVNENEATDSNALPLSHHHHYHLLHMRLRGLGDARHNENLHNSCVICAEAFVVNDVVCQLPCGHIHHSTCILQWLDTSPNATCPTCRQQVSATPSTGIAGVGQPNDVDDEDSYFNYETRRHCKPLLQKRQNFDLIMRRTLRARQEQRQLCEETTKQHFHSRTQNDDLKSCLDNVHDQDDTMLVQPLKNDFFHDTTHNLASSNHIRRTSISNSSAYSIDLLVDDFAEILNPTVNDDDQDNNHNYTTASY